MEDAGAGSLRQTILDASDGDEITFSGQLIGEQITLSSGPISIDRDLTLVGPGADSLTISGNGVFRVFEVQSDVSATISGLTIANGFAELNGGGVWIDEGASLRLEGTVITDNSALDNGGGVFNTGGATTTVVNSIITKNEAQGDVSPNGGGLYNAGGEVMIESSTISENESFRGGGIWNGASGIMTIKNTSVSNNTAGNSGGGIFNSHKFTIISSTISGNQAELEAGGIKNRGGDTLSVINSTISENQSIQSGGILNETAGTILLYHTTLYGNQASSSGAGISNRITGKVSLYSSIVALNGALNREPLDILNQGFMSSLGHNFISNGDADENIMGSQAFVSLETDLVGTRATPLNPLLDSLIFHDGSMTATHVPIGGSPIIDKGDCQLTGIVTDQLGASRAIDIPGIEYPNTGDGCDIGSIEAPPNIVLPIANDPDGLPRGYVLEPAFPNPFAHQAQFEISVAQEQHITITLHNALGQHVQMIYTGFLLPNRVYRFGIDASRLASGAYFYTATSLVFTQSRSVLVIK